jgi:hypothetical protein
MTPETFWSIALPLTPMCRGSLRVPPWQTTTSRCLMSDKNLTNSKRPDLLENH